MADGWPVVAGLLLGLAPRLIFDGTGERRRSVARLSGFRWIPGDPVLRERRAEPARREAWLRDQYRHVEEHRHTLREVHGWFRENHVEYLRAFPDTLLASEPLREGQLFEPAEDDWGFENVIIAPHYGGSHPDYERHVGEVFLANLRRYVAGEPLASVIDKEAGY